MIIKSIDDPLYLELGHGLVLLGGRAGLPVNLVSKVADLLGRLLDRPHGPVDHVLKVRGGQGEAAGSLRGESLGVLWLGFVALPVDLVGEAADPLGGLVGGPVDGALRLADGVLKGVRGSQAGGGLRSEWRGRDAAGWEREEWVSG